MAQNGDEAVCGGAGKGCYGKYLRASGTKKSPGGLSII